jgi:hypothetical protein
VAQRKNSGWVVVVFENENAKFAEEVAYVKGPFAEYEAADDWMATSDDCGDGKCQITFIESN